MGAGMCVRVCILCGCVHVRMHICVRVSVCARKRMCMCVCIRACAHIHAYLCASLCVCASVYARVCVCAHMRACRVCLCVSKRLTDYSKYAVIVLHS